MNRYKNSKVKKIRYYKQIAALAIGLFCLYFSSLQSQTTPLPEYKIKAVFIFNFTQFVEWPGNVFNNAGDPFVIGILGKDPFGDYINKAAADEKIGSHPLIIVHYQNINEVNNCQVLFIGNDEENLPAVLSLLNDRSILTVSDSPGFAEAGGMIGFVTANNKIKLQINLDKAKAAHLNISSKLLGVADIK